MFVAREWQSSIEGARYIAALVYEFGLDPTEPAE
jgi:hypothetical protein